MQGQSGLSRLNEFVAPRPSGPTIVAMTHVNRVFMLRGMPLLRDIPLLNRFPPFRGLANVRDLDFPASDKARLAAVCGLGQATFITPNHPEFFTDWMIDKEIMSHVAPMAASWATNGVVNGLGGLAQRFWLANNLIAQIPGNSDPAKQHSIAWACKGHGVLLHPEGMVGWHGDHVAQLMPGAAEMAFDALERGRAGGAAQQVWLAPIVWKLSFQRNVEAQLAAECGYVERRLKIETLRNADLPQRVFNIYRTVLRRDAERLELNVRESGGLRSWLGEMRRMLCARLGSEEAERGDAFDAEAVLKNVRRDLRKNGAAEDGHGRRKQLADGLASSLRLGEPWAFANPTITQEEIAEHIKRLRNDYCKGTLRDTMNAYLPQPAGPRTAHIRAAEPIAVHEFEGSEEALTALLRQQMQAKLDEILAEPEISGRFISSPNPFYEPAEPVAMRDARRSRQRQAV